MTLWPCDFVWMASDMFVYLATQAEWNASHIRNSQMTSNFGNVQSTLYSWLTTKKLLFVNLYIVFIAATCETKAQTHWKQSTGSAQRPHGSAQFRHA